MLPVPPTGEHQQEGIGMSEEAAKIRAAEVTIVGENGADRVILQSGPDHHASMRLLDKEGQRWAAFTIGGGRGDTPGYVGLNVFNADNTMIARFGTTPGGRAMQVLLNDQQGRPRLRLQVAEDGTPSIEMLDAEGNVTWRAG
jgi:hypothetical protein